MVSENFINKKINHSKINFFKMMCFEFKIGLALSNNESIHVQWIIGHCNRFPESVPRKFNVPKQNV